MVSNQIEFNNQFSKETKQISIRRQRNFQSELTIKNYLELENLNLRDVRNTKKITLTNLPQLTEVTIWNCGMRELVIESCPQIKKLIIRRNDLNNLNFISNLEKLEELDLEGNLQLSEILKSYKNDWKAWQRDLKEIREASFTDLVKKFSELKQNREELKKTVAALLKDKEKFTSIGKAINTKELVLNLSQEFQEKEENIKYLELRAQELTKANKEQKDKIISTFAQLLPERDLLQKLITNHLELSRFKKQAIASENYDEKIEEYEEKSLFLKKQLRKSLSKETVKETMNNIQAILNNCEKLVEQELELEVKLSDKSALITSQEKKTISQQQKEIIALNNQFHQKQLEELENLKKQNSLILTKLKEIKSSAQSQDIISKLINQLTHLNSSSENEEQLITKLRELIAIKQMFLNNREQLLNNLRDCCDLLEKANLNKYARIEQVAKSISAVGKLVSKWTVVNIVEPIGDGSSVVNSRNKRKFAIKSSDLFQSFLKQEDQSLSEFKQVYLNLVGSLPTWEKETEPSLFTLRYKVYEIATNIWKDKAHLEVADMKDAISALQTNYLDLQAELKTEEQILERFSKRLVENSQALVLSTF